MRRPSKSSRARATALVSATLAVCATIARADPPLPTFGSAVYNITTSYPGVNGGTPASTAAADNAAAINTYISYCSTHGGGTVEMPGGTFLSGTLTMQSNVNFQLDSGAVLRDTNFANTLIQTSGSTGNMEISGSGIIDGNATTTKGSAKLIYLQGVTTLAVLGVSIENAGNEHLVTEGDSNVTIQGVTIADPGTLAANGGNYLGNTDGIDYWGSNFLIKNCNVSDGDDNIVAKPASGYCSNILITGDTIGAGHGISVGGGAAHGLSGLTVTNCTFNGTTNGIRLKAEDASGGDSGGGTANPVQNVNYSNLTMTSVANPIIIDSFYNGNNNFPTSPTSSPYPATATALDSTTPIWSNVSFNAITANGASNGGLIYGLKTAPLNLSGLSFNGVNISAGSHMDLWYANNVDLSGLKVTVPSSDSYYNATPIPGVYAYGLTNVTLVPYWNINANGNWSSAANWSSIVPNGTGVSASFGPVITAPRSIAIDAAQTIGILTFNSSIGYTITGTKTLTLNNNGSSAAINVNSGSHVITSPLVVSNGLAVTTSADPNLGQFSLTLPLAISATGTLSKSGAGTLAFNASASGITSLNLPAITITGGTLALDGNTNHANRTLVRTSSLTISSGRMDFGNNDLDLQAGGASGLNTITAQVIQGLANSATGIVSSTALGNTTHLTTLGLIQNNQSGSAVFTSSHPFDGIAPGAGDVLLKYTWYGDANLDGKVDGSDYSRIDSGYLARATGWWNGDFNYDGAINGSDYTLIDNAFNTQGAQLTDSLASPAASIATQVAAVPEPRSFVLLCTALASLHRRRRR